jgi:N utilization substance protein B
MSLAPDCRSELLVRRTDQRRAAVFVCYQRDVTGAPVDDLIDRGVPAATSFTRELVEGVEGHRDELDDLIEEHAIGWHLNRIAPLERAILRTALFEILHRPDVPDEVAIDEAVETAKLYGGAEAPPCLNGILAAALERVRHA